MKGAWKGVRRGTIAVAGAALVAAAGVAWASEPGIVPGAGRDALAASLAPAPIAFLPPGGIPAAGGTAAWSGDPGREIYESQCAACHQLDGRGVEGMFPPLVGSRWVTGDPERLLKVLLHGLEGDIEVLGEVYTGLMAPVGGTLNDAEIAAVATYIRTSWGNEAEPITRAQSARVRTANRGRTTPWTQAELGGPPDGGK